MRKLLLILATLVSSLSFAQKVTLDFTSNDAWGFPEKDNAVTETQSFSDGTYTISLYATTAGYYNTQGYLMLGKSGSELTLPAFDFAVGTIVVTGRSGASASTKMNIQVDGTDVSTQTTGSTGSNTYEIATDYQAIGTVYSIQVQSNHNAQFTKIEVYEVGDEGDSEGDTEGDTEDEGDVYTAALTDTQGDWTISDVTLPDDLSYIWTQTSSYGMKASAYYNSTNYAAESYLISPVITLQTNSVLTFDHVQRYGSDYSTENTLWIREEGSDTWTQLTIPTYSDGSSWTFVSSGDIDLSAYNGKNIQLGFLYTSTADAASTWEIKNVKITNATAQETESTLTDPTNTAETAYTVAQAIAIIDSTDPAYDLTQNVYVKGIITSITEVSTSYGNATYTIADAAGNETTLTVYRGYFLENAKFTSEDQIAVGDEVIVYGTLTLYGSTYELSSGNYIYSLNGATEDASLVDPTNTAETAYTVAEALAMIDSTDPAYDLDQSVYVKGIITSISQVNTEYGNATYYIADATDDSTTLYVYRGYYLENAQFTSEDQITVGDEVIIYGTLTLFYSTYEFSAGNYIYSLNGITTGLNSISTATSSDEQAYDLTGRKVNANYKGIVIQGGKKIVVK